MFYVNDPFDSRNPSWCHRADRFQGLYISLGLHDLVRVGGRHDVTYIFFTWFLLYLEPLFTTTSSNYSTIFHTVLLLLLQVPLSKQTSVCWTVMVCSVVSFWNVHLTPTRYASILSPPRNVAPCEWLWSGKREECKLSPETSAFRARYRKVGASAVVFVCIRDSPSFWLVSAGINSFLCLWE